MGIVTQDEKNEIVQKIADGKMLPEISRDLNVQVKTLEKRLEKLKFEYKAKTSCHLVAIFIRYKIIN